MARWPDDFRHVDPAEATPRRPLPEGKGWSFYPLMGAGGGEVEEGGAAHAIEDLRVHPVWMLGAGERAVMSLFRRFRGEPLLFAAPGLAVPVVLQGRLPGVLPGPGGTADQPNWLMVAFDALAWAEGHAGPAVDKD